MNSVQLIGRLTRDPEVRYTGDQMAIASFSIAIDRPPRRDGTKETDFPRITVFGKQAENCEKYLAKGRLVGIEGRIQTGSYTNRNGDKVYTTDVVANRVEFLEWGDRQGQSSYSQNRQQSFGGQSGFGQSDFGQQSAPAPQRNDFGGGSGFNDGFEAPGEGGGMQQGGAPQQDRPSGSDVPLGFQPIDEDDIPF